MSRKSIILVICCTAVLFEALDIAIVNLAMALIQRQFHLDNAAVQWLQTLYVLFYGGFLIIGGKLADVMGRKKIFMSGAALFLVTSLGAGLSPTFGVLLIFRAVQGLAAALLMPSALSIITNTFTDYPSRSKAVGIFSAFAAIGSGLGLSAGGFIATYLGWQWIFFINVPVVALTLLAAYRYIDPGAAVADGRSPDILSALLLTVTIVMLSYVVHELGHVADKGAILIILTVLTLVAGWYLLRRMSTSANPLLDFSLFRHVSVITGHTSMFLLGAFFNGYLFTLPLILQQNMSMSAAYAGLLLFPFTLLSAAVGKLLVPRLLKRLSALKLGMLGILFMLGGALLLMTSMILHHHLGLLVLSMACITGIGIAICFISFTMLSMHQVPAEQHGLASSVATTLYFLGSGLGLSILALMMPSGPVRGYVTVYPVIVLGLFACMGLLVLLTSRVAGRYASFSLKN
jgi:MFS family permease